MDLRKGTANLVVIRLGNKKKNCGPQNITNKSHLANIFLPVS